MSKFLELCEQLDPINSSSDKWKLIDFLKEKGINVSPIRDTDTLYIDTGEFTIAVNVIEADAEEEAENVDTGEYDVNKEVEGLAGKAQNGLKGTAGKLFGTSAQRAKTAVQKRQGMAKQAVGAYEKKTQQLQQDLRNIR